MYCMECSIIGEPNLTGSLSKYLGSVVTGICYNDLIGDRIEGKAIGTDELTCTGTR